MTERGPADPPAALAHGFLSLPSRLPPALRTLARHQVGAMVATGVDFGVMVALVEGVAVSPVAATAVGATAGAVTNFALGRTWIFGSTSGAVSGQIGRYALASAASAALNALGEHIVHDLANVRYLLARALVALAVGVLWNFPMHRHFVFR